MIRFQNALLASASVFAAWCIGYALQSTPVAEMRYGPSVSHASPAGIAQHEHTVPAQYMDVIDLELTSITYTSASSQKHLPHRPHAATGKTTQPEKLARTSAPVGDVAGTGENLGCVATMSARPLAAAMVQLDIEAPCAPLARLTLHHNGMMITEQTDPGGSLSLTLPALSERAIFMAAFENGLMAMANAEVTSLDIYDRVVVQWKGPGQLQVHALEFGADYGDAGHVWADAPRDMTQAARGQGGFVTVHGSAVTDHDLRAQVYTFPSGTAELTGEISLSVETEITAATCDRQVEAQAMQISGGGPVNVIDLTIDMPGCDAQGDFLVLKNLFQDLKIARN
ncbi:MAG: hypothetical protein ACNA7O_18030 [Rhodobacterales bacterium]